jgi:nitroreductase
MKRRGVKSYTNQQISDHDLEMILAAGIAAPSGRNLQGRHFTVVQNKELLKEINDGVHIIMGAAPDYVPLYGAPTLIVTSGPADIPHADMDCAAAVENMLIAATSLGLGSRFIVSPTRYIENNPEIKKRLEIPKGYRSVACMIVGYDADPSLPPVERNKNVVNYVK